jgi:hypothetical protein
MAHEFIIESQTFDSIKARHLARGRLYTFRIVEGKQGRRILKGTYPRQVSEVYERAMAFAECEAGKA